MNFKTIIDDLKAGENIDSYLALTLGLVGALIGIFGARPEIVAATASAVLTLVALGILADRKVARALALAVRRVEDRMARPEIIEIRKESFYKDILEPVIVAKASVWIMVRNGSTLDGLSSEIREAWIGRKCNVRIILCARDEKTVSMLAFRGNKTQKPEKVLAEMNVALDNLRDFAATAIHGAPTGILEVHELPYIPPYGITITDYDLPTGQIYALFVAFQGDSKSAPSIKLHKADAPDLFQYFTAEYERYWQASTPLNLK